MTPHQIRDACAARGCAITWSFCPGYDDTLCSSRTAHLDVDHATTTTSGSRVFVEREFPGDMVVTSGHWDWTPEQCAAIEAWVEQLHRMPLEEIP